MRPLQPSPRSGAGVSCFPEPSRRLQKTNTIDCMVYIYYICAQNQHYYKDYQWSAKTYRRQAKDFIGAACPMGVRLPRGNYDLWGVSRPPRSGAAAKPRRSDVGVGAVRRTCGKGVYIGVCRAADVSSRGSRQGADVSSRGSRQGEAAWGQAPLAVLGGAEAAACSGGRQWRRQRRAEAAACSGGRQWRRQRRAERRG